MFIAPRARLSVLDGNVSHLLADNGNVLFLLGAGLVRAIDRPDSISNVQKIQSWKNTTFL